MALKEQVLPKLQLVAHSLQSGPRQVSERDAGTAAGRASIIPPTRTEAEDPPSASTITDLLLTALLCGTLETPAAKALCARWRCPPRTGKLSSGVATRGLGDISHRDFQGGRTAAQAENVSLKTTRPEFGFLLKRSENNQRTSATHRNHHDVLPDTHMRSRCAQSRVSAAAGAPWGRASTRPPAKHPRPAGAWLACSVGSIHYPPSPCSLNN